MGWPGLGREVSAICNSIGIPDVNEEFVPSKTIKSAVFEHHYSDMMSKITGYKKLEPIANDNFRDIQSYFHDKSVYNGRMAFRIRCQMLNNIQANFKSKFKKNEEGLICKHCTAGELLSQSHCIICPGWETIREGLDMTKIKDLVQFFRKVLLERGKIQGRKA